MAVITGVSRVVGIGAELARRLAADGFDIAVTYLHDYDVRARLADSASEDIARVRTLVEAEGAAFVPVPLDLADPQAPADLFAVVGRELRPVSVLVMSHCESIDSDIFTTSVEAWDRHFAVNARATWLLVRAYAEQVDQAGDVRRIVALTSDHVAWNLPYGASKGALDRVVEAAANELADRGVRCNAINPGGIDTGWMDDAVREATRAHTMANRLGTPQDVANLVSFLCSPEGGWLNAQLLYSNGGRRRL